MDSTWMGDRLGIPGAVRLGWLFNPLLLQSACQVPFGQDNNPMLRVNVREKEHRNKVLVQMGELGKLSKALRVLR